MKSLLEEDQFWRLNNQYFTIISFVVLVTFERLVKENDGELGKGKFIVAHM